MCLMSSWVNASYFMHLFMRMNQEHRHSCIMMYASLDQHHDNCIAPPLQSYILWVHHYHGFEHLHLELEDFVITLDGIGIHKHVLPLASYNSV